MRSIIPVLASSAAVLASSSALAAPPVVQAVQVGAETVRYERGVPTVDLRKEHGAVQIRPLPLDHGSLAFSVAVLNESDTPTNIDVGNFAARAGQQSLGVFTHGIPDSHAPIQRRSRGCRAQVEVDLVAIRRHQEYCLHRHC